MLKKNMSHDVDVLIEDFSPIKFTRDYCLTFVMSNEKAKVEFLFTFLLCMTHSTPYCSVPGCCPYYITKYGNCESTSRSLQ